MKYMAAVLISLCIHFSAGAAVAATPAEEKSAASVPTLENQKAKERPTAEAPKPTTDNRASMLSIILVAGVMIVGVKLAVALAKKKMEEEIQAAKAEEKAGSQEPDLD